jgi:uncharacterized iron-regulated protein
VELLRIRPYRTGPLHLEERGRSHMKKIMSGIFFFASLFVTMTFNPVVSAQIAVQNPPATHRTIEQNPLNAGREPKPDDATEAILTTFNKYEVVAMGAAHGNKDLDDFILHLVRSSNFPTKVNDIVVECGNSLYQPILDRYIAGEDVPLLEVRQAWRNTTQLMCNVSGFYETLFPLVRRINQKLPPERRLRVLAADPPIDWSKVRDQSDTMLDRDGNAASVMEKEVLSKHRKALVLFGMLHLFHSNSGSPIRLELVVQRYEKDYPGVTLVIADQIVFYNSSDLAKYNGRELESRMASWPVPSLVQDIPGTWLGDVNKTYFSEMVDAYLYLGPGDLLLAEPRPAEILSNKPYMAELRRRAAIIGVEELKDLVNPDTLSDKDFSPFLLK